MHTEILEESTSSYGPQHLEEIGTARQPALRPIPPQPMPAGERSAPGSGPLVEPRVQTSAEHDLEVFLRRDPNVGAVHGVRVALLLNAGLALTGILAWELWTLLAL